MQDPTRAGQAALDAINAELATPAAREPRALVILSPRPHGGEGGLHRVGAPMVGTHDGLQRSEQYRLLKNGEGKGVASEPPTHPARAAVCAINPSRLGIPAVPQDQFGDLSR